MVKHTIVWWSTSDPTVFGIESPWGLTTIPWDDEVLGVMTEQELGGWHVTLEELVRAMLAIIPNDQRIHMGKLVKYTQEQRRSLLTAIQWVSSKALEHELWKGAVIGGQTTAGKTEGTTEDGGGVRG